MTDLVSQAMKLLDQMTSEEASETYQYALLKVKSFRSLNNMVAKFTFKKDSKVCWSGTKGYHEGVITKVNRTTAYCSTENEGEWKVSLSLLKPLEGVKA